MKIKVILLSVFFLLVGLALPYYGQTRDYQGLKTKAEVLYEEGSYALAYDLYRQAAGLQLKPEQKRWVEFRLADSLWRAQNATNNPDHSKYEKALKGLEELIRDVSRQEDKDQLWAQIQESLGDYYWLDAQRQDWHQAWPHYQQALDWWAGSRKVDLARERYTQIIWKTAWPAWGIEQDYYYYGHHGNYLSVEVLDDLLKIVKAKDDKARAHYLMAISLSRRGNWQQKRRLEQEFELALKFGRGTDWYDDVLFRYAQWLENEGRPVKLKGGFSQQPDYVTALKLYQRLIKEFKKGQTRYYDQARERIEEITKTVVGVSVYNVFLPGSKIQFNLNWRNARRIDFTLYKVDLSQGLDFSQTDLSAYSWLEAVELSRSGKVKAWSRSVEDRGDYQPDQELVDLDFELPGGAYILQAKAKDAQAREIILVTESSVVFKASGKQALVYFCSSQDGSPIAEASVGLWERSYNGRKWVWRYLSAETDSQGLCRFELSDSDSNLELYIAAALGGQQAFALGRGPHYYDRQDQWRIYAFCDRPAYRPQEQVNWKFVARGYDGQVYTTPANQVLKYEIFDPQGSKVKEDKLTLNSFGSVWGSLELSEDMPLGEYRVNFRDENNDHIGDAVLFRLEEYKLPEFKVAISTPQEDGRSKVFILGDTVEAEIQADYYFGAPVACAEVEVLVYQNPFHHYWQPRRDYPWLYEDHRPNYYYGGGQLISQQKLKTDSQGKAAISFETPLNSSQDLEYRLEARVVDASRREITASETIRVTAHSYYVYLTNKHNLCQPQDKVEVDIKAIDANDQPLMREGIVKVTRDYWYEAWINPEGREVFGPDLEKIRAEYSCFPPPPDDVTQAGWQLKQNGYEHDDILTQSVTTDEQGEAEFSFTPQEEGYYRVSWLSPDEDGVSAETTVWVADNATTELGYRHGGLEIIVDKDTFSAGQKAAIMLSAPSNGRYVLFSVETEDLFSYQLVYLKGRVKLIELALGQEHTPNIFLAGVMVSDQQIFTDSQEVVVPPVDHFLEVEVSSDRQEYRPRQQGKLAVRTRDHQGRPVSAEVSLGLVDESVYYIQSDYAADPRQFFYGTKRSHRISTESTFNQKRYARLMESANGEIADEEILMRGKDTRYNYEGAKGRFAVDGDSILYFGGAQSERGMMIDEVRCLKPQAVKEEELQELLFAEVPQAPPSAEAEPAVQVRSDFRSTIFWQPDLVTDKEGQAEVEVKFADSLTTWKATARAASAFNQFGIASGSMRTKKPLIARLQAPRFFVVGDQTYISANINNNTEEDLRVTPRLTAEGLVISGTVKGGKTVKGKAKAVKVPAGGQARVDWVVEVRQAGTAKLTLIARAGSYSDAMEKTYPVYEHGIEKFVVKSGKVKSDDLTVALNIPAQRKRKTTELTVQLTPSLAVTMLDALPYLIDYPYGCTEQTMSRFLPAVITAKTLGDLDIASELVMNKIFGGIEPEYADKTHTRVKQDLKKLEDMVEKGLRRLYDFQHADGGWGWWKEGDSDHFMTAYVVWGLKLAGEAGIKVKRDVLRRAVKYLNEELVEEETNYDIQAWMLHALSYGVKGGRIGEFQEKAFGNLWDNKDRLNAYTRALLALSAHYYGYQDQAQTLIRNLVNGVEIDDSPDTSIVQRGEQNSSPSVMATAHWGEDGIYWRWSEGGVEATGFCLKALLEISPDHELIEPVTNWLIKNRRGAQWSNTRDTAIVVLALNNYLETSGELASEFDYDLLVNNHLVSSQRVTPEQIFSAPSKFTIDPELIKDGINDIRIKRKSGRGPIYFSAQAKFFSLEEPISPEGNEIFLRRQYYKLVGRPTLLKGHVYDKQPLNDQGTVASGERVEVVLTIEAKNNYEYLVLEDLKPAGLEAVAIRSGEPLYVQQLKAGSLENLLADSANPAEDTDYTGESRSVYQELRDRKVALFIDKLPQGVWQLRYELRAEVPGSFHTLPVLGHAMYVPEIRANGAELRLTVEDKE